MKIEAETKCFGGQQLVIRHASKETGTDMTFGLFLPPLAEEKPVPLLLYLSGLTCTHENVMTKAGAQQYCAELGLAFLAPDTSPRGLDLPGEHESYDFGSGAGFYLDATVSPYNQNYRMQSYILKDLLPLVFDEYPVVPDLTGITGHSMGGHGALTLALKNPGLFKSVSAFAPISAPMQCPWGQKAFSGYLGGDKKVWLAYDATALMEDGYTLPNVLVDQGLEDPFLKEQLMPEALEQAAKKADIPITMRYQEGYDHSYYFISTFMEDHVRWAIKHLIGDIS